MVFELSNKEYTTIMMSLHDRGARLQSNIAKHKPFEGMSKSQDQEIKTARECAENINKAIDTLREQKRGQTDED